jgi:hypothetical protein
MFVTSSLKVQDGNLQPYTSSGKVLVELMCDHVCSQVCVCVCVRVRVFEWRDPQSFDKVEMLTVFEPDILSVNNL